MTHIAEAQTFIEQITGQPFQGSFGEHLKNGVVLCELLNKLKPGAVKVYKGPMAFKQMENIAAYIDGSRAAGVEDSNNFMTVDLFEAKNLAQVALNVITLKRKTGHGMDKQTPTSVGGSGGGGNFAPSELGSDQSSKGDVALPAAPVELKSDLKRVGAAHQAGFTAVNEHTGVKHCHVCSKPISGACVNAVGVNWHPTCFTCGKCGTKLFEAKYFEHEKKPYCDRCILMVNPQHSIKAKTSDKGANLFAK